MDESSGRLSIRSITKDVELYTKLVTLSYGALFGPDAGDIQDWEEIATTYIDSLEVKN